MQEKIKVILVDDSEVFIKAIMTVLAFRDNLSIVGVAYSGVDFLDLLKTNSPDIVLMDIHMPDMSGIHAANKCLEIDDSIKVIGVTMSDNVNIHKDMLSNGFRGGILKNQFTEQFDEAIAVITKGDVYFPLLS